MEGQQKGLSGWLHPKGRITTTNPAFLGCSASGRLDDRFRRSEAHYAQEAEENRCLTDLRGEQVVLYHGGIELLRGKVVPRCLTYDEAPGKASTLFRGPLSCSAFVVASAFVIPSGARNSCCPGRAAYPEVGRSPCLVRRPAMYRASVGSTSSEHQRAELQGGVASVEPRLQHRGKPRITVVLVESRRRRSRDRRAHRAPPPTRPSA